jgi:hypothetical protein
MKTVAFQSGKISLNFPLCRQRGMSVAMSWESSATPMWGMTVARNWERHATSMFPRDTSSASSRKITGTDSKSRLASIESMVQSAGRRRKGENHTPSDPQPIGFLFVPIVPRSCLPTFRRPPRLRRAPRFLWDRSFPTRLPRCLVRRILDSGAH